jgi:two-component system, cell cycle sensor histidine kinase and response regulator CckA
MNQDELIRELESLRFKAAELQELQAKYEAMAEAFDRMAYKYTSVVDASPDPIIMYDLHGNLISVSQKAAELVDLESPEDFIREVKNVGDLLDQRDRERALANFGRTLKAGISKGNEYLLRWKDGRVMPVEVSSSVVRRADGEAVGFVSVVRDISERKKAQELLRASEERYRRITECSLTGIYIHQDGVFQYVNSQLAEMMGYSPDEIIGKPFWVFLHPEDQERVKENVIARLEGKPVPDHYEMRIVSKSGDMQWLEVRATVIDHGGRPAVMGNVLDITERKRAEEAVRESEELFRTAFQTSPDPASISRLSDGVFIEINDGFGEFSGFTREEVIGKSSLEVNLWPNPEDRDRLISKLNEKGYVTNLETQIRQKDGQVRTGLMSTRIIVLGGEPHILSVTRDLENWKKAKQELRESEEKYRTLFEESRDPVIITTRDGRVEDLNQAFLDLFGFTREETQDMDVLKVYFDPADRWRLIQEIERDWSVQDYPVKFRRKDGAKIDCLISSTVRRDKNGSVVGYQSIIRDVTEWNRLQKQLLHAQKMEAVGTLAGGIAHDFNNLLQVILGYTDLMLTRMKEGEPDRRKLEMVHQAARDGADLVSRILTFSMKTEFRARPIDLNHEIRRFEKLLLRTIPRMITIDLVLADGLWIIDGDPAQIKQVLLNLALNAQYAMPDGGRLLVETSNAALNDEHIQTRSEAEPGKYVLLAVSDTGTGMDPGVIDRMFEPFFTTKADGAGTGLGLAMVHGIVSQHGGHIACYSESGIGTSFKIYFPASENQRFPDTAVLEPMPEFGAETILLVDDDDRVRDLAQEMTKMWGYKALTASSGEEALETYAAHKDEISLVILDLIMPGMGGKRCLEELLRIDPDAKILLASGHSSTGLALDHTDAGLRGFIRKPYDAKDMLGAIRKVLDNGHL